MQTSVYIEAGALIAKVNKTAWPKNREELEDTNWLLEKFYEFESPTPNRLAYENRDYVSEERRRAPMVKLMPNSPETENTLIETDNALGLRFKLFGKRSGSVFHWDKGSNTCYYINPWFQQGEKVLYTDLWRVLASLRTKAERYHTMELRIDEKDLKLLGLNMEIVHDFIIRLFGVSKVRFWIIPDQPPAEVLNEDSIKGAPAVLSTISEDAQFNADVHEIMEALLENAVGVNNQQKDVVEQIVYNFRANFAKDDNELGLTNLVEHNIDTSENAPIKLPAYKTTPAKLAEIKKQVQQMLDLDIIQPSKSDWSAPVVLVGKKDGTSRFCVDFRKLNAITKKDAFPLPLIDQILDCLEGAQFYSSLDLAAGYWQVPLTESARPKTAFSTPDGATMSTSGYPLDCAMRRQLSSAS